MMEPPHQPRPNTRVLLSELTPTLSVASQDNLELGEIRVRLPYIAPHVDVVLSKRAIDQFVEEKNATSPDENGLFDIDTNSLQTETQAASALPELAKLVELAAFSTIIATRLNPQAPSQFISSRLKMPIKDASSLLREHQHSQRLFVRYATLNNFPDLEICEHLNISPQVLGEIRQTIIENPAPDWGAPVGTYNFV